MGFIEGVLCKLGIAIIIRAGRFLIDWATQKWLKRRIPRWFGGSSHHLLVTGTVCVMCLRKVLAQIV